MKSKLFASIAGPVAAMVTVPCALLATNIGPDAHCGDPPPYQYQQCGTVASGNTYTVNSTGTSIGVFGVFEGFSANDADTLHAELYRGGNLITTSSESLSNQQLAIDQTIPIFSNTQLQVGDIIQIVFTDHAGNWHYYSRDYASKNPDGINHIWAEPLTQPDCAPGQSGSCAFVGLEDTPTQNNGDFDYNDFKMWLYGIDLSPGASAVGSVPEPSSLLLLSSALLMFVVRKLL